MTHAIYEVTSFELAGEYSLRVRFNDGAERLVDLSSMLEGELFGPLKDPALFEKVRIDPEVRTLVWPNGADLDPATLHDWPTYSEALAERAVSWQVHSPPAAYGKDRRTNGSN